MVQAAPSKELVTVSDGWQVADGGVVGVMDLCSGPSGQHATHQP